MSCEELLEDAGGKGMDAVVLTDINSTAACLNFVRLAPKYNIKPVLGIDFRNGVEQLFIGIAKNNQGYYELNRYLSQFLHSGDSIPEKAPVFQHAFVIYPFSEYKGQRLRKNEYLGVTPQYINRLRFSSYYPALKDKLVILQTATFRNKKDFNAHRLLRAIDNNTLLSKLPKSEEGDPNHRMLSKDQLIETYSPHPEIFSNTLKLISQCSIYFEFGDEQDHKNQKNYTHSEYEDYKKLCKLCYKGLSYRYKEINDAIKKRLKTELQVIREKQFIAYFLINWDIVTYARRKGYFYVGRGSGANSIIAYLLRITDVDPIDLDLYFERFINLYRKNPPDFDIDFSWTDREDITSYIFKRFKNVALLATYSTFQLRAVIRELGKVFGLPAHEIEKIAEGQPRQDYYSHLVLKYGHLIQGFPSHLSIHAGGILISQKHIHYFSATDLPPKGYPTTHFDMVIAEDVGLYKFDILSQRGLGKIKDTLAIVKENKPQDPAIDIHDLDRFKKDELVKSLLKQGKAIGCFYVESPAMRMLLKKLEADDYLGLVAASSIIRPGVAKSGMMREYILRFRHPERRKEAHPILMNIMPETFGVMVYQEDVIKVAHYYAGLTLAEADVLRRGMSGKFRSRDEFQKAQDKYFTNCKAKGYSHAESAEIWRQIESFAGYAFSKGHSASYAVESYQSLFLKAYYPMEYMVATINNFGGFYRTELYVHEARMHGAKISPPCANMSDALTKIYGNRIYLGLSFIKDLDHRTIEQLLIARGKYGDYISLTDFVKKVPVSLDQASLLIKAGVFQFTGKNKKELLWEAHFLLANTKKASNMPKLFEVDIKRLTIPNISVPHPLENAFDEMELLGFPLCNPFDLLRNKPDYHFRTIDFPNNLHQTITIYGYLVAIKNTSTTKKARMNFGTFLDVEGHFIDTVHFPQSAAKWPFRGRGIYAITGKVVEEFGFYSLEVTEMTKEPFIDDPRYSEDNGKLGVKRKTMKMTFDSNSSVSYGRG